MMVAISRVKAFIQFLEHHRAIVSYIPGKLSFLVYLTVLRAGGRALWPWPGIKTQGTEA